MNIKNKLYISAGISIVLVVALVSVVLVTSGRVAEENEKHQLLMDVHEAVSELDIVTYDYLLHREERMEQQWNMKYDSLGQILDEAAEEEELIPIRADYAALGNLFSQITTNNERIQMLVQAGASQETIDTAFSLEERLVAQLLITSHSIITDASNLAEEARAEAMEAQRLASNLTVILMIVLAIAITTSSLVIARNISKPLDELTKGTEIIGKGDLEHKVGVKSKDELGKLATAFNKMTENLKKVTTSRDELEVRVEERTHELRVTNEQLIEEISQRKQAEERLEHLNRVLRAIRSINQLIVREKDRGRLLKEACDNLAKTRDFYNAWIALLDESGKLVTYAEAGWGEDFLPMVERLNRGELPNCCQQALRQAGVIAIKDPSSTCGDCPLAIKSRGRGAMAIRLEYDEKVYGLLVTSVPVEFATDEEEQSLFQEVAGDIVFALHDVELQEERKRMEGKLRQSQASLVEAQRIAHLGNWDWDITNNTLWWSDEIYRIFGLELQAFDATYEAFLNSVHPDDRELVQKSVDEALHEKKLYSIDHRIVLPDGSQRVVHEQGEVTFDESGKPVRMRGTVQDITERRKMEEQLIVSDRLASLGEMASGIAHELNNPLTGVIGFSQLLLEKDLSDDVKEDVKVISREAQRTAEVVKNLLTFARKREPGKKPVDINNVIQKVLELRAYEQKVNNIQVNTRFASDLPEIMGDGFQLQQVFLNIIINAEHFMLEAHGRGALTITTERVGDIIRASFADDGPGITKENLGHLFDPFFTTKEVGRGTGLGLSICHGMIAEHGGRIYAESELGKGATFIVELPISQ